MPLSDSQHPKADPRERKLIENAQRQAQAALARADETATASNRDTAPDSSIARGGLRPDTFEGYEILREIHRGGQGIVYQAVQQSTKRKVAIKVMLEGPLATESARRRFEREIELVAQLKHPNIISIFHSGVTDDGHRYCVMDYVRGLPLNQYMRQSRMTLANLLSVFTKVCDAVSYAHQKGIIHRDLKPSNVLVDADGEPKVLDFGLAKQMSGQVESLVSVTGQVVGTLPYMSPEQTHGNPDEIDVRTDVYALGVILYELLTGHYPYPVVGRMADVLRNIAEAEPQRPRSWSRRSRSGPRGGTTTAMKVNDEVETIVLKALAKERARRYQSADSLGSDIRRYLTGLPIEAKRDSSWYLIRKLIARHRMSAVAVASVFVAAVSFAVISFEFYRDARSALREKERSQALAADRTRQLAAIGESTHPVVRRLALGWFLLAWEAGDAASARRIHDQTLEDTPEREAMTFLLDPAYTTERLLAAVPHESEALAYFVSAMRNLNAGRSAQALSDFESCLVSPGDGWIKALATARVQALRTRRRRTDRTGNR